MLEALTKLINLQSDILISEAYEFLIPFALVVTFFALSKHIFELFTED